MIISMKGAWSVKMKKRSSGKHLKVAAIFLAAVFSACLLTGCGGDGGEEKIRDLEFEVVEEASVPEELAKLIEEKKLNEFRLTYTDDNILYLATGFGEQETGGYSIAVDGCYLTETSLVFETSLIGPAKDETVQQKASYPYIVVKTENREEPVIFR